MTSVLVNPPKTPVTEGTNGVAAATLPNICKMPGPPAPFVPTPLPNIGKSGTAPRNYSKSVTIEGKKVAIRGATFGSMGDVASKGTGGGLASSNVEGPTNFVGPGSMDVKIEGKNIHLLGEPMLNNCGPCGSPPNAATMTGVLQESGYYIYNTGRDNCPLCNQVHGSETLIEETKDTKDESERLANELAMKGYNNTTMLGVGRCECKKEYYAHRSGSADNDSEFCTSVERLGWHGPKDVKQDVDAVSTTDPQVLAFLKQRFKHREADVQDQWTEAGKKNDVYNRMKGKKDGEGKDFPAAYVPGSCAAPKVLMLIMQDEAWPGKITERWFHKKGSGGLTGGEIEFHDVKLGAKVQRKFEHGETVPPCTTCGILVPLMLCVERQRPKCRH
ncbi:PAAR-like domain-containing protein [Cystobacter fuscus]|uniref:PAAR-like domain-containing protein n=1 Tax=Cystobacter fuscus TaxID=43 RepID=UPI002B2C3455|nr:DUF4150 domain-containing protein [Cystobacter fuscus]